MSALPRLTRPLALLTPLGFSYRKLFTVASAARCRLSSSSSGTAIWVSDIEFLLCVLGFLLSAAQRFARGLDDFGRRGEGLGERLSHLFAEHRVESHILSFDLGDKIRVRHCCLK